MANHAHVNVSNRQDDGAQPKGVYVQLDELARLQHKASGFSFLPKQPIHSVLSGRHASKLRGRGLNFEELRDYLPGDDTRNIDWKVTARTGSPYVRVYTEEKDRTVWLLIDQRVNMFFGSKDRMKSVVAAEVAAISAWRVLSVGDRVGALVFNDAEISVIPPHRSRERVMQILKQVVDKNHALNANPDLKPDAGKLNEALKQVSHLARHDCLVCLITDGNGLNPETRRHITRLAEHNDVLTAFIFDPLEKDMPAAGRLWKPIPPTKSFARLFKMNLNKGWNRCSPPRGASQCHCCHWIHAALWPSKYATHSGITRVLNGFECS